MMFEYEHNPAEIYRQSFDVIARECELTRFSPVERGVVVRMIHACGMIDLTDDIFISPGAVKAGIDALGRGSDIICDVEMVRRGIIADRLSSHNNLLCEVGGEAARKFSKSMNTTRSAGGIEALKVNISGSIVAIGNAPTALFHLLELLQNGLQPPALVIGCPVGFVGAVESKRAMIAFCAGSEIDLPVIAVRGRRGGSAMAAAAINALAQSPLEN